MTKFLEKKNKRFIKKINYQQFLKDNKLLFYEHERKYSTGDTNDYSDICVFSLKRSNFIDYLFSNKNNKVTPYHQFRKPKVTIPFRLKTKVWKNEFGKHIYGICPISTCNNQIKKASFSCGHIISEANDGELTEDNLRPICKSCNSSMGGKNWEDYDNESIEI